MAVLAVGIQTQNANAQGQSANAGYVTVLDVAKVFKNYPPFAQKLKQIEGEAQVLRDKIQQQQQQLQSEAQSVINTYKLGTPERKQAEGALEQKRAKMMTESRHAQTDLLNREAKLYFDTYVKMNQIVSAYAKQAGISLVIRFESDPIDRENRGAVIKGVNRNIVYQNSMDITVAIIKQMHAEAGLTFDVNSIK